MNGAIGGYIYSYLPVRSRRRLGAFIEISSLGRLSNETEDHFQAEEELLKLYEGKMQMC